MTGATVLLMVCLVAVLDVSLQARDSPMVWKRPRYAMPWKKGPNVCAVEEMDGTGKRYYSDCMPAMQREVCGRPTFVRYHCCTGYERIDDGKKGCRGVVPVLPLIQTFDELSLRDFAEYTRRSGLDDRLRQDGPHTVFAPDRKALRAISGETRELLTTDDETTNLLRMHVVQGRYFSKDLRNDMKLPSIYYRQDEAHLKINRYSNGIMTVNCVRVILPDQVASNGVVHIMEKVIEPHPSRDSVMDILLADDRFGEFVTALILSDVGTELRDVDASSVTIFAPTDYAFRRASPELILRLFEPDHRAHLKSLLKFHIIDHQICSPAILGLSRYRTQEGQTVNLTCDVNGGFFVDGIPILDPDLVGENGVIHAIDELLIPDSVKSVEDLLLDMELGQFQEYAQQAGLSSILRGETPGNFTFFVPNAEAFQRLTDQQRMRIQTDSAVVGRVFKYHVVPEHVTTLDMSDGMALETLSGPPLRAQIYQQSYGVNSALITGPNNMAGNGIIHIIDRVLFPPEETAMEKIKSDPRLSTFASLLQTAGLDERLDRPGHYSILAPSNEAIDRLPTAFTEMLMLNEQELSKALSYHLLHKPVFSDFMREGLQYRYQTLSHDFLHMEITEIVDRDRDYVVINDDVRIIHPNIESTSGVIHIIDDVLQCPCVEGFMNWGV